MQVSLTAIRTGQAFKAHQILQAHQISNDPFSILTQDYIKKARSVLFLVSGTFLQKSVQYNKLSNYILRYLINILICKRRGGN